MEVAAPVKSASHFTGQAATRQMSFRYSRLCGTASNIVDAVRSAIPTCWVEAESEDQRVSNFKNINR